MTSPEQQAALEAWEASGLSRARAASVLREALPALSQEQRDSVLTWAMRETGDHPELVRVNDEGWFVLDEGGAIHVARFMRDEVMGRERLVRYSIAEFRVKLRKLRLDGRPLADAWLEWSRSAEKNRVVFRPHGHVEDDALNLWRGFGVEPNKAGAFERIDDHILNAVCAGDPALCTYLYGWMARMVQRPTEPAGVAVVLRGKEGVGKSVVAKLLRRVMGQHGIAVSSPKHIVGDFNAHLQDAIFVEASEALFAGDRQAASKLKSLITDDTIAIERKGADAVPWRNMAHILMTSNEDWVVPAGPESRRYFVLDVGDEHRGDTTYFDALFREVDSEESVGGFLQELLDFDLSTFNHRQVPVTDALRDQRERSMTGILAWASDLAERGVIRTRAGPVPWRSYLTTGELYEDFEEWRLGQRYERPLARSVFGRELRGLLGEKRWHRAPTAAHNAPAHAQGQPGYAMPPLREFDRMVRERSGTLVDEAEAA